MLSRRNSAPRRVRRVVTMAGAAALVVVSATVVAEGVAAAGGGVSTPTVALSSTAAGATGVTYTVGFTTSSTGAIPAGGTITLVAPPGTQWPGTSNRCNYVLTDSTTSSGSFSCAQSLSETDSGLPVDFLSDAGRVVTVTVPNAIAAGDTVSLQVAGVVNPSAGSGSVAVSTSADPTPAPSASFTITAPNAVSAPSVALSSTAAGASGVTYTVGFTTSSTGAVPAGGTITLVAPPGTQWPGTSNKCDYALTDSTTSSGSFSCAQSLSETDSGLPVDFLSDAGRVVTVTVPNAIAAGDTVSLQVTGVVNPSAGSGSLAVSTSADPTPAASASFAVTAPHAVSSPSVGLSSSTAGASGVTYTLGFTTSATGAIPAGGTITLVGPAGTQWPSSGGDYALTDHTHAGGSAGSLGSVVLDAGGAVSTVAVPNGISAGDALTLTVQAVVNPGASTWTLSVQTAADTVPATSAPYVVTGAAPALTSVHGLSLSTSTTAAGASGVTYTVGFTTSATGSLTGGSGTITLVAPSGTLFGACPYGCGGGNAVYTITDATHSSGSGGANPVAIGGSQTPGAGSIVTLQPANTIQAGDTVTVTATQVTNPSAGSGTLLVSTSSDAAEAAVADTATAAGSVSGPSFSASSGAAGATGVTDTVGLTTSATGTLVGGSSSITLTAPSGTLFGACPYGCGGGNATYTITDATHPSGSGSATPVAVGGPGTPGAGASISLVPANTIQAGDSITLTITQAANPPAGPDRITLTTSSDTSPAVADGTVTAAGSVANPAVYLSDAAVGASSIYEATFTTSSTGALGAGLGAVTLTGPPGTVFSPSATATFTDATHSSGSGTAGTVRVADGGASASFVTPGTISAGDQVALVVQGVTNTATVGHSSLSVSTSSDILPATATDTLGPAQTISGTVEGPGASGPVQGAEVEACNNNVLCATTTTDSSGDFQVTVIQAAFTLTALPPAGSADQPSQPATFTAGGSPLTGVTLDLQGPASLANGVSLATADGQVVNSSGTSPRLNWSQPYQLQLSPSLFPSGVTVVATQVVVHGVDEQTGKATEQVVDIGGSVGGLPVGVVVGSQPIDVDMPPSAPIHGDISYTVDYQTYPTGTTPPGLASAQVVDLVYPNQAPSQPQTDPLAGYVVDNGAGTISVGGGTIVGTDASSFSVIPLSSVGVPPGTNDCGSSAVGLTQYMGGGGGPAPANECGVGIQFTPPSNTTQLFFNATLNLATSTGATVPIRLVGCDENVAQEAATVTGFDPCNPGGPDPADGPDGDDDGGGSGGGGGSNGGGGGGGQAGGGGGYEDPSGTVDGVVGSNPAVPLPGATVTLLRGATLGGPYSAVANGSAVMSPENRTNPDTTGANGDFGWDVLAGSYEVQAAAGNCTTATTPTLVVPPPVTGLSLNLACTSVPTRATSTTSLATSQSPQVYGQPVTFTASVSSSGSPTGTVTFADGSTTLGTGVLASGTATLTTAALAPGTHSVTATYAGDGSHAGSSSSALSQQVVATAPVTVTGVKPSAGPAAGGTRVTIKGTGFTGATAVRFGGTPATGVSVNKKGTVIKATSPAGTGLVHVTVVTPAGPNVPAATDEFDYAPSVTKVAPSSGSAGATVTVKGLNLTGATAVHFGATAASITSVTAKKITVTAPSGPTGTVDVTVTGPGGTSPVVTGDRFTYH